MKKKKEKKIKKEKGNKRWIYSLCSIACIHCGSSLPERPCPRFYALSAFQLLRFCLSIHQLICMPSCLFVSQSLYIFIFLCNRLSVCLLDSKSVGHFIFFFHSRFCFCQRLQSVHNCIFIHGMVQHLMFIRILIHVRWLPQRPQILILSEYLGNK